MLTSNPLTGLDRAREAAHKDAGLYPYHNRFYKTVYHRKMSSNEVFWMDTLCIPVGLGKQLRRKAISQMNFIFAGADNVLVIDPELQLVSEDSVSKLQLRLQLACSPWMTRCWTFQEARLARVWHLYLRNGLYQPARDHWRETDSRFRVKTVKNIWTDENELEREAISFYDKLWPLVDQRPGYRPPLLRDIENDDTGEFVKIWRQLNERSTTARGDRLVILAILLDLNAGEISSLTIAEQMRAILRTQKKLPLSLLFEPKSGPLVESAKCRWIPLYPRGDISTAYGCMVRNQISSYFQFTLSDIKALGFLLDAKDSDHRDFLINQTSPFNFGAWIRAIPQEGVVAGPACRTSCIILSCVQERSTELRTSFVGARFFIENMNSETGSCTLVYDCPLVYVLTRPVGGESMSASDSSPDRMTKPLRRESALASDERPEIEVTYMPEATQVSLDCGKTSRCDQGKPRAHVSFQTCPTGICHASAEPNPWVSANA